jgi:hypothetical protein
MTMEEQPQALEQSYAQFYRMTTPPWHTEQDWSDALQTLKGHLTESDRMLRLPPTSETARARSKLILWSERTRGNSREMGQQVVLIDTSNWAMRDFIRGVFGRGGKALAIVDAVRSCND